MDQPCGSPANIWKWDKIPLSLHFTPFPNMDFHINTLLNLPNVVVVSYSNTLDAVILNLQLINDGINCPNCNEYICKTHQTRPVLVKDLSVFGQLVYLKVPRRLLGETHAVDVGVASPKEIRSEACRQTETSARRALPRRRRMHPQFYCPNCKTSPTEPLSLSLLRSNYLNKHYLSPYVGESRYFP
jgi:hypothetical protein